MSAVSSRYQQQRGGIKQHAGIHARRAALLNGAPTLSLPLVGPVLAIEDGGAMAKALMVVGANPTDPAHEAEFNRWYTEIHLDDVLKVAGFTTARRYALSDARPMVDTQPSPFRYLAVYDVESDDLERSGRELQAALDNGAIPISETFDLNNFSVDFYAAIPDAERHTA